MKIFGWDSSEYLLPEEKDNEEAIATGNECRNLFGLANDYEELWKEQPEL